MPLLTIKASNANIPAGSYRGTFQSIEEIENEHGNAWRWVFNADGKTISGLSDRDKPPTPKNKTGRWLSALSGKPLKEGVDINTDDYVGKSYLLIVEDKGDNKTALNTFIAV